MYLHDVPMHMQERFVPNEHKFPVQRVATAYLCSVSYISTLLQCAIPFIRLAASKEVLQYVRLQCTTYYVCDAENYCIFLFVRFIFERKKSRSTENYSVFGGREYLKVSYLELENVNSNEKNSSAAASPHMKCLSTLYEHWFVCLSTIYNDYAE